MALRPRSSTTSGLTRTRGSFGSAFVDVPNDANFCADGIIWPYRTPHPALHQLKSSASRSTSSHARGRFRLRNRHAFSPALSTARLGELQVENVVELVAAAPRRARIGRLLLHPASTSFLYGRGPWEAYSTGSHPRSSAASRARWPTSTCPTSSRRSTATIRILGATLTDASALSKSRPADDRFRQVTSPPRSDRGSHTNDLEPRPEVVLSLDHAQRGSHRKLRPTRRALQAARAALFLRYVLRPIASATRTRARSRTRVIRRARAQGSARRSAMRSKKPPSPGRRARTPRRTACRRAAGRASPSGRRRGR